MLFYIFYIGEHFFLMKSREGGTGTGLNATYPIFFLYLQINLALITTSVWHSGALGCLKTATPFQQ